MEVFWQEIYQSLLAGENIVVATVVSHRGSTPRISGSKMLIDSNGRRSGTIGGGSIEADVIQLAMTLFSQKNCIVKSYNLNASSGVAEMDLICGGQMQVLIEFIESDDNIIEMHRRLNDVIDEGRSGLWLGRLLKNRNTGNLVVERSLQIENESWLGAFNVPFELQKYLKRQNHDQKNATTLFELENQQYVLDSILSPKTVYIIGAGHVSREIAPLAHSASFRTVIVDDRAEYADIARFPLADRVSIWSNCSKPLEGFPVDENSYIVIVTRGHRFDKEALVEALGTKAGYIGMIGSRKKRDRTYASLLEEGFTGSQLEQVHCPIGLSIAAETPFEIAISIIAELIRHRAVGKQAPGKSV